jgi:hypothetical protein
MHLVKTTRDPQRESQAIVNSNLGVTETLALLDKLRSVVEDFATREERLNAEFRAKVAAEERTFEIKTQEQKLHESVEISNADAVFQAAKEQRQSRFDRRKIRINEAHKRTRKKAVEAVGEHEGRRKNRLQQQSLGAERKREADLAKSAADLEEFKQKLAANGETFARLELAAHKAFRGYPKFRKKLSLDRSWPEPDTSPNPNQLLDALLQLEAKTAEGLERFRKRVMLRLVRFVPPAWFLALLLLGVFASTLDIFHQAGTPWAALAPKVEIGLAGLLVLRVILYLIAQQQATAAATALASDLAKARRLGDVCYQKAELHHQQEQERIKQEFTDKTQQFNQDWKLAIKEAIDLRDLRPREIDEHAMRVGQRHERLHQSKVARMDLEHNERVAHVRQEARLQAKEINDAHESKSSELNANQAARWEAMVAEWKGLVDPLFTAFQAASAAAEETFPDWQLPSWANWAPPDKFKNAAKFGRLEVDMAKLANAIPKDSRLALPGPSTFSVPLLLTYPRQGSILLETGKLGTEEAVASINNLIFRLLATTPPGKLSFTIFDPVGLGQNFAGIMHLADFEESHINSRIWTQTTQFEEKLAELSEHMEKVIQMYLRNEYETIAEYNAQAGTIAEKYHVLVVASFPVNFSDTANRRLRNIAASGARCGVYTLIHWDQRQALPQDFVPDELRKNSVGLVRTERGFELAGRHMGGMRVLLDNPPTPEFVTNFLHQVGEFSKDSNRVEVPFAQVAPAPADIWSETTTEEIRVPIGRSGATKLQIMAIGKGTRQHALIAGKTGSGKSTLFHIIITNLSLWCSPEQIEFYLVDFKKGVEFKCYANRRLPQARVVAIESDRQFGLSVLERVDMELRRRGDLFRRLGVQDLPGYKRAGGTEAIPRSLLMIDEFQEFFVEEDRISQSAAVLLDRIVRQGRAFGIHVLLGSQTLGGAYTLARATIGQMVIRIALQCNEADAYLIMDQDNPAPRLLSRPGEGIYNDEAGAIEGNSPFQAVWLSDDVRDEYLAAIREKADRSGRDFPGPFVFEGNAPADVRENAVLAELLEAESVKSGPAARVWLGSPNSIKGPTEAALQRQSANNLLIVGQNEEAALALVAIGLASLALQYPVGAARFVLLDSTTPDSPQRDFLDRMIQAVPHEIIQARTGDLAQIMGGLAEDLKNHAGNESAPATFILIHGLQNFKKLRQEDEFSFSSSGSESGVQPAAVLLNLLTEGPSQGFHVIATCDTYNNVTRFLGRKTLSEFAMRVLFQMSASDSASLIDNPDAGTLGLHRALFYNDREGYLETFRPYSRPGNEWIESVAHRLKLLNKRS